MEYCIWIVSPKGYSHSQNFYPLANSLKHAFRELGYSVPIVLDSSLIPRTHRPIIIGGNLLRPTDTLPDVFIPIIFNLEQADGQGCNAWMAKPYVEVLSRSVVWDYSLNNIATLLQMGINATHLEIGYSEALHEECIRPGGEETIDVLFYGSMNARRAKVIENLLNSGVNVVTFFNRYGDDLMPFVAASRIVLNMHYYEAKIFEMTRCMSLLANGKFIVSETGNDRELEDRYAEGIAFCPYNELVATCIRYLQSEKRRRAMAKRGFEIFSSRRQSEFLQKVLS